jgi:hypothetical protein
MPVSNDSLNSRKWRGMGGQHSIMHQLLADSRRGFALEDELIAVSP